eukprot:2879462-Amphidinium_carterae.2
MFLVAPPHAASQTTNQHSFSFNTDCMPLHLETLRRRGWATYQRISCNSYDAGTSQEVKHVWYHNHSMFNDM